MSLSETLDEMDTFPVGDDSSGLLVDPNMIPTVATEVVMGGDGIEREFGGNGDEYHEYEYAYDDEDHDDPHNHHPHHLHAHLEEEEVVVGEEEYPDDWKDKKVNLYDALDGKMYLEEKPSKNQQFVYQTSSGTPGGVEWPQEVDEYREYIYTTPNRPTTTGNADRPCPGCGMTLRRSVFYHHARMIREKGACNLFTPQRFPCPQCDSRIGTLEKLCQHMEQIHNAPTQIKTITFPNHDAFLVFRTELEGKGGNFRMARGNKKNKKGGIVQYYRCNRLQTLARSQTFRPVDNPANDDLPSNRRRGRLHQQDKRTQSAKQVIRTENSCTAFYNKAYLPDGSIEVRYCDHHLHDDEKLRLPDAVRKRVIDLAKKNLPHIVILMIVKDERFRYCERNSANDRRIQEMKTQDIRQVLAGNTRAEKTRQAREGAPPLDTSFDKSNDGTDLLLATALDEIDANSKTWPERPIGQKVDRLGLSAVELRYLDLFDSNREEIMARLNEKARLETEKKMHYDSFIHRLSSSQDIFKSLSPSQLPPTDSTIIKLKRAFNLLTQIEQKLLNPLRDVQNDDNFISYIKMMEEESRNVAEEERGTRTPPIEEIVDVVGIDEDFEHQHHLHDVVEEEEVVGYGMEEGIVEEEEEGGEYMRVEEGEIEIQMEEVEAGVEEAAVREEEEVMMEPEAEQPIPEEELPEQQEEGEETEPTVTRAGRIVKKKPVFDS